MISNVLSVIPDALSAIPDVLPAIRMVLSAISKSTNPTFLPLMSAAGGGSSGTPLASGVADSATINYKRITFLSISRQQKEHLNLDALANIFLCYYC
ncbi:hypothetical protein ACIP9C_01170 [Lysinibacillus sp. NPDC093210]|uniref:hypothetical protein n=1 Tax=Lysinibacillus sp. NPDC093210 TaxID=3364133 RepID=UPI0038157A68